ncbi:hypothetical protein Dimus_030637, partial [Dionaea muscipula]
MEDADVEMEARPSTTEELGLHACGLGFHACELGISHARHKAELGVLSHAHLLLYGHSGKERVGVWLKFVEGAESKLLSGAREGAGQTYGLSS